MKSLLHKLAVFAGAFVISACHAKQVGVHDPVMAKEGNTWYVFSTGPGITFYSSTDMVSWKPEGRVFEKDPVWAKKAAPSFDGHIWAPDIDGRDLMVLHAYETADGFKQKLKIVDLKWDKDGWPLVDPENLNRYQSKQL